MSGADPRIAVVVLTHNRKAEILRTLGKLIDLPERPGIVVVDNGSTDGTALSVRESFPQVEVVLAGGNLGAAGRNLGVRYVATPYVALCDDDTWWEPGALRQAADRFDACPRLAVATGRLLVGPEEREDPICAELTASPVPREAAMPGPALLGFLAGASVVRRSAFLEAGGFNPRLFLGGEEELLALDLAVRGWWLCYLPELVVHHHPSPVRDVPGRRWHMVRNALWCAWLRRPLGSALRKTAWLLGHSPWDRATLRGLAAALAELPWVVRERRPVPREIEKALRLLDPPGMWAESQRGIAPLSSATTDWVPAALE
jgi:GT2 family glycosyltransferase